MLIDFFFSLFSFILSFGHCALFLTTFVQKTGKRSSARQRIGDDVLGYSSTNLDIVLHHNLASSEVSDDEVLDTIFVAKLSFRNDEVTI